LKGQISQKTNIFVKTGRATATATGHHVGNILHKRKIDRKFCENVLKTTVN